MPAKPPSASDLIHLRGNGLKKGDPLSPPMVTASMYHLPGAPEPGVPGYGRAENPTWEAVEHLLGAMENAPSLLFPSGMAAIAAPLMALLKAGDRVLLPSDGYYTTRLLAEQVLKKFGVVV